MKGRDKFRITASEIKFINQNAVYLKILEINICKGMPRQFLKIFNLGEQ
jgi:hypothetical protein